MENYSIYKNKQAANYTATTVQHQGTSHLVVPVVMMVEGVHAGSHGPMFHSIAELGKFPESWNGRPVVIDHPEINGVNISANRPEIIEQQKIGSVYNTHIDGTKLMAELWINEEKIRQMSAAVLAALQAGQTLEVSLGMFTEEEVVAGTWHGETYNAIARNHRPDHLALLPGGRGACSVADGCGIRANKKGGNSVTKEEWIQSMTAEKEDHYTNLINANVDQGYKALVDAARQKFDAMDSENSIYYLQEVYSDFLVYEVRQRVGGTKLYKQDYSFNGSIELKGNPVEVRKKVEYETLAEGSGFVRTKFNNNSNKEVNNMADNAEKCTPCIKAKVDALIAHASKRFAETDRVWLETLSEDQLVKLEPVTIEKEVTKEITKEVNVLSDEDKAALADYKKLMKEKHDTLVKRIQDNTEAGTWTPEELTNMSDVVLEKMAGMIKTRADYSLNGGSSLQLNESNEEALPPTGIKFKK
jgi:hypothetical protein